MNHQNVSVNSMNTKAILPKTKRKPSIPFEPEAKKLKSVKETESTSKQTGHRPVTSCTFCRQHKIRCNASEKFPSPCQRCERMNLKCEIDPQFRPKKGSQIQSLRNDVDELRSKIEYLQKNESLIAQALASKNFSFNNLRNLSNNPNVSTPQDSSFSFSHQIIANQNSNNHTPIVQSPLITSASSPHIVKTYLKSEPNLLSSDINNTQHNSPSTGPELLNDSAPINHRDSLPLALEQAVSDSPVDSQASFNSSNLQEFLLGDVRLPITKARELHDRFIRDYLPYLPIITSNNAIELYQQSQLLFWTVILTASLSEPEPTLYMSLSSLIRQLAIETCWIRTPRSAHIIQALLILSMWPLPNQKVLDDASYRFIGLAKNLGSQLGLHRGKFMDEFSRTQVSLADAELWRTRCWLCIFFAEQFWSSCLGLPPSLQTDYLLENARIDKSLPKNFRCLISLAIFQSKLVNVMGISVTSPDGLMEPQNRAGTLAILDRELERLVFKLEISDLSVECYYLYVKLMICCFAFLPETPIEDQTKYVTQAYLAATRIVTIISKLVETRQLIELPIYIRQSVTNAVLILFRLHLTRYLLDKYVDSARQSIVTVHRLFRNTLSSWKDLQNDISRTAKVLENLNFVLYTHPELFIKKEGIISRMRSHLTGSLFYDLVWCVHEAKRISLVEKNKYKDNGKEGDFQSNDPSLSSNTKIPKNVAALSKKTAPLPFYNQITKDDFTTITTTTPNGTTVTTLVPTDQAMNQATANATAAGLSKPTEINGIPLAILEATGSVNDIDSLLKTSTKNANSSNNSTLGSALSHSQQASDKKSSYQELNRVPTSKNGLANSPSNDSDYFTMMNQINQSQKQPFSNSNRPQSYPSQSDTSLFGNDLSTTLPLNVLDENVYANNITGNNNNTNSNNMINNDDDNSKKFINGSSGKGNNESGGQNGNYPTDITSDINLADQLDNFFQQQSAGWTDNNDDFLGWFDVNMAPEF